MKTVLGFGLGFAMVLSSLTALAGGASNARVDYSYSCANSTNGAYGKAQILLTENGDLLLEQGNGEGTVAQQSASNDSALIVFTGELADGRETPFRAKFAVSAFGQKDSRGTLTSSLSPVPLECTGSARN